MIIINFTPVPRHGYTVGVPENCFYREIFNSDAGVYGGGNVGNMGGVMAKGPGFGFMPYSVDITVPPLGGVIFKPEYFQAESAGSLKEK